MSELSIGSTVWVFDKNRREYRKDANGRAVGGPIWIKHWVPRKITGQNRASWILELGDKVPKKDPIRTLGRAGFSGSIVATSWDQVKEMQWAQDFRWPIIRLAERADAATLRQIAALVGYVPEEIA